MRGDRRLVRLGTRVWWLLCGEGRLPPDVSEQTMGSVLRAVGDSPHGSMGPYWVCDGCGLPRPCGVGPDPFAGMEAPNLPSGRILLILLSAPGR
jgi:hypothetical protein